MSLADSAQKQRNILAHRLWGGCRQRPDLLALVDPNLLWKNDYRELDFFTNLPTSIGDGWDPDWIDPAHALAYSTEDLSRILRDMEETRSFFTILASYLSFEGTHEQAQIFDKLSELKSFRSALNQIRMDQRKSQSSTDGSPPPTPSDQS